MYPQTRSIRTRASSSSAEYESGKNSSVGKMTVTARKASHPNSSSSHSIDPWSHSLSSSSTGHVGVDQNIEGALWAVVLRTTIGQNGNECRNKQPQQSLYEEEEKSPEAESFDPLTYFHARTILCRHRAKQQKAHATKENPSPHLIAACYTG